jgi:hypothetical protein
MLLMNEAMVQGRPELDEKIKNSVRWDTLQINDPVGDAQIIRFS